MRVSHLIKLLADLDPDAEVCAFDADCGVFVPLTGLVYDDKVVELQTDVDYEER